MKKLIILPVLLVSSAFFAQVGINTIRPQSTLDIVAKTTDGSRPEGLIAPRLTGDQLKAGDAQYGSAQKGAIIYVTTVPSAPDGKTADITKEGYYFFNGSKWQEIGSGAGDTTNDAWINDTGTGMVKLGSQADGTARAAGTEVVIKDNGAVGIGTGAPDASAALDIVSAGKGVLIPRVALSSATDVVTIPSPATGLLAYNTGAGTLTYKGFVFWNGKEWRKIDNTTTVNPVITGLNCNTAFITPAAFAAGTAYSGTLTVYYSGGNGGSYSGGTTFTQNGLTFTLDEGTLNKGNGYITYSVTGTPNFSSPTTITVPVNFLGFSCNATIGQNTTPFVIGEIRSAIITVPVSKFLSRGGSRGEMTGKAVNNTTSINRRSAYDETTAAQKADFIFINGLRMDFIESWYNTGNTSPKLYNITSSPVNYNVSSLSSHDAYTDGIDTTIASGYYSYDIDGDDNFSTAIGQGEYVNAMLTFPNKEWYNCTWHARRDGTNYYFYFTAQRLK
ncbi:MULTISPECIES: hypothetical protein [Chryseobacterium]|uniref:Uncharacterized protein n=1 Tax=Chryseobacterium nepalense TaxID=1854498 RepID=A0ABY4JZZ0_9FLAO|nr:MULTISPECIES: hypothetical protein [Chryseobacterium]MEA1849117.1 hypothetical protein [Chryseobacterium sp. MHB01]UPQ74121.1 hypothetical protein M0D58_08600 [Chryseobacterium nepalense]